MQFSKGTTAALCFCSGIILSVAAPRANGGTTHTVNLSGLTFSPRDITIAAGDTIRWVWMNGFHNVESGVGGNFDGNFRSGNATATPGTVFEFTFDQAFLNSHPRPNNRYPYYCIIHVAFNMIGSVTVTVPSIAITGSNPPSEAIDARQPIDPDDQSPTGWQTIDITFDGSTSRVRATDFTMFAEPVGQVPAIVSVTPNGNTVTLELDVPISAGAWTTITHEASGTSVRLGFQPADVNGDGTSNPSDILDLIDALNGILDLPLYATDANRSDLAEPSDILTVIDLLNGAGNFEAWNGRSLP